MFFSLDQTAPAHQGFLRHLGERVKTQAWVALSVYVLVAIVKKQLGLDLSLYKILQILSVTVFERTPILEGFSNFSERDHRCRTLHPVESIRLLMGQHCFTAMSIQWLQIRALGTPAKFFSNSQQLRRRL